MTTTIVIPARYASSRFPGKPLAPIKGADGIRRTLLEHTWIAAQNVTDISAVYVATDDARIAEHAQSFGANVVFTSSNCKNGTERCAEAISGLDISPSIIVNLQGDAPLTPPWFIQDLVNALKETPNVGVATPVLLCGPTARAQLIEDRRSGRVGATTVVFGKKNRALYFSKEVLPFGQAEVFHHVGIYAYRPEALNAYRAWTEGRLEKAEGLEQCRFLENDFQVLCVEVDPRGREFWEVNNPEDIARVEAILRDSSDTVTTRPHP